MTTPDREAEVEERPIEWTDWRESPAVQADEDRKALLRIATELEEFLVGAPSTDPNVVSLRRDLARMKRLAASMAKPISLSKGLWA